VKIFTTKDTKSAKESHEGRLTLRVPKEKSENAEGAEKGSQVLFAHQAHYFFDQQLSAALRAIQMHEMGCPRNHHYAYWSMHQVRLQSFAISRPRPEIPLRGQYKGWRVNQGCIPQLPACGQVKAVLHRATRRTKARRRMGSALGITGYGGVDISLFQRWI